MAANAVVDTERRSTESARDRISLTGIAAFGRHGVFDFERDQGQRFVVDVSCTLDLAPAASADDLTKTIDYGALAQAVAADVERDPLNLIEALADRIALTCLRYEAVQSRTTAPSARYIPSGIGSSPWPIASGPPSASLGARPSRS